jgi:hypothetical protein
VLLVLVSATALTACGGRRETSGTEANPSPPAAVNTTHTNADWASVSSDPDAYKGDPVRLVGRVLTAERDKNEVTMQAYMAKNSEQNTVVTYRDAGQDVDYGVYVRITGKVKGKVEGRNLLGDVLRLPAVQASSVVVVDALEAALPAHSAYGRTSSVRGGVRLTVRKIEAAPDETRVFVTVDNRSAADFHLEDWAELVADEHEIDFVFSSDHDYPDPAFDLTAGSRTSGVMVFEAVPKDAGLRLTLSGHFDDLRWFDWTFSW